MKLNEQKEEKRRISEWTARQIQLVIARKYGTGD